MDPDQFANFILPFSASLSFGGGYLLYMYVHTWTTRILNENKGALVPKGFNVAVVLGLHAVLLLCAIGMAAVYIFFVKEYTSESTKFYPLPCLLGFGFGFPFLYFSLHIAHRLEKESKEP